MESATALEAWVRGVVREVIGGGEAAVLVALPDDALATCQAVLSQRRAARPGVAAQVEMVAGNATYEELRGFVESPAFVEALAAALAARGEEGAAPTLELATAEEGAASQAAAPVGDFVASDGALRLVGCPAGYLL
eukprot:495055-Rhodomonas_salina.1